METKDKFRIQNLFLMKKIGRGKDNKKPLGFRVNVVLNQLFSPAYKL